MAAGSLKPGLKPLHATFSVSSKPVRTHTTVLDVLFVIKADDLNAPTRLFRRRMVKQVIRGVEVHCVCAYPRPPFVMGKDPMRGENSLSIAGLIVATDDKHLMIDVLFSIINCMRRDT